MLPTTTTQPTTLTQETESAPPPLTTTQPMKVGLFISVQTFTCVHSPRDPQAQPGRCRAPQATEGPGPVQGDNTTAYQQRMITSHSLGPGVCAVYPAEETVDVLCICSLHQNKTLAQTFADNYKKHFICICNKHFFHQIYVRKKSCKII